MVETVTPDARPGPGRMSWVAAGVGLTLGTYCLAVVLPYAAAAPGSVDGVWSGPSWVLAVFVVQLAPLMALVAGPWALWHGVRAVRRGQEQVAATAAACVVLCAVLAGLSLSPVGLSLLTVLMD